MPKLADVVSVSAQFLVSNIVYFFVENEFLQNPYSDDKFARDSGTRVLLKRNDLMSQKYCARIYDKARAVVAYCFIGEIFFGSFRSRRTAKRNATDTMAEEKNFARCNLLR